MRLLQALKILRCALLEHLFQREYLTVADGLTVSLSECQHCGKREITQMMDRVYSPVRPDSWDYWKDVQRLQRANKFHVKSVPASKLSNVIPFKGRTR